MLTTKHNWALGFLLSLILIIPLLFFTYGAKSWVHLRWESPIDLAMLEWIGSFICGFLVLILFEQYRKERDYRYLLGCSAFLIMGVLSFGYALIPGDLELAIWFKVFALAGGGFLLLLAAFWSGRKGPSTAQSLIHGIIFPLLIAIMLGVLLIFAKVFFPSLMEAGEGSAFNRLSAKLLFCFIAIIYFIASLRWLHLYQKKTDRYFLIMSVFQLVYAQFMLVLPYAPIWSMVWWIWHIILIIMLGLLVIYFLILCVRHSLVWRLLLSLGFMFGITIVITASVFQSYLNHFYLQLQMEQFSSQQKQQLTEIGFPFAYAIHQLPLFKNQVQRLIDDNIPSGANEVQQALTRWIRESQNQLSNLIVNYGIVITMPFPLNVTTDSRLIPHFRYQPITHGKNDVYWTPFNRDRETHRYLCSGIIPLWRQQQCIGYLYLTLDVNTLKRQHLTTMLDIKAGNHGHFLFDRETAQVIDLHLPLDCEQNSDSDQQWKRLFRSIMARCVDLPREGLSFVKTIQGEAFHVYAYRIPETNLVMVDLIEAQAINIPTLLHLRHVIISVAMATLLGGFTLLLLLLNYQLALPMKALLRGVHRLEQRHFDEIPVLHGDNELAHLSRSFYHMTGELRRSYEQLENGLRERTEMLHFVEKANRSQIVFFENVSHELRTPLHGILSFAHFGLDPRNQNQPEKIRTFFEKIHDSSIRLQNMIQSLLDVSLIETGDVAMDWSHHSLFVLVLQAWDELKPLFDSKQIEVEFQRPTFDTSIDMDRRKMNQVLKQLFSIAFRCSSEKDRLNLLFYDQEHYLTFSVQDSESTVPLALLEQVFSQWLGTTFEAKHNPRQLGLGLGICREIIKLHHGSLQARHLPDGGFTLSFSIPKRRDIVTTFGQEDPYRTKEDTW